MKLGKSIGGFLICSIWWLTFLRLQTYLKYMSALNKIILLQNLMKMMFCRYKRLNLRIREDTTKYLLNLDVNSAHCDPKTRSMRYKLQKYDIRGALLTSAYLYL